MCFGPVASFTASAFLASMGTVILKNIRAKKEPLFAAFPMLFAIQQFIEGVLWLAVKSGKSEALVHDLTFGYLTLAYSLWPILCPASVYAIEYDRKRRKILRLFIFLGLATSAYLLFFIIRNPVYTSVVNCSIHYKTFIAGIRWFTGVYILVTILPYFLSSHRSILIFGIPNLIFCAMAYFVYQIVFISVWCFSAALISTNLYFFLRKLHHKPLLPIPGNKYKRIKSKFLMVIRHVEFFALSFFRQRFLTLRRREIICGGLTQQSTISRRLPPVSNGYNL